MWGKFGWECAKGRTTNFANGHEWFFERVRSGSFGEGLFGCETDLFGAGIGRGMGGKGMAAMPGGNWTDIFWGRRPVVGTATGRRVGMSAPRWWECSADLTGADPGMGLKGVGSVPQLDRPLCSARN